MVVRLQAPGFWVVSKSLMPLGALKPSRGRGMPRPYRGPATAAHTKAEPHSGVQYLPGFELSRFQSVPQNVTLSAEAAGLLGEGVRP